MRRILFLFLSIVCTFIFIFWVAVIKTSFKVIVLGLFGALIGVLRAYEEMNEELERGFYQ